MGALVAVGGVIFAAFVLIMVAIVREDWREIEQQEEQNRR